MSLITHVNADDQVLYTNEPRMNEYEGINFIHMRVICMSQVTHSRESHLDRRYLRICRKTQDEREY